MLTEYWHQTNGYTKATNGNYMDSYRSEAHVQKSLYFSKGAFTRVKEVRSMVMWYIVPVKNFIVPVLNLQIDLGNYFSNNLLCDIDSDVEKLSTGEEFSCHKLSTVNQLI